MKRKRSKKRKQRKPFLALFIIVVAVTSVIVWDVLKDKGDKLKIPTIEEFRPVAGKLDTDVYVLGGLQPGVAYAINTSAGIVLIDSGLQASAGQIAQQLYEVGLRIEDVKIILLTHAHADHILGAKRIRQIASAKVYAGAADCEVIEAGAPRLAIFSNYSMPHVNVHPTKVDVQLHGGEKVTLGETVIEVISTPGHSPGSLCFELKRNGERFLFTGDTISTYSADVGAYITRLPPRYRGNATDYLESLEKLERRGAPDFLLPGHPALEGQGKSGDVAKITSTIWDNTLARAKSELQVTLDRFEADGADFLDGDAKQILPEVLYLGEHQGSNVYCLIAGANPMIFGSPSKGLKEFVSQSLEKLGKSLDPEHLVLTFAPDSLAELPKEVMGEWTFVVPDQLLAKAREDWSNVRWQGVSDCSGDAASCVAVFAQDAAGPIGYLYRNGDTEVLFSGAAFWKFNEENLKTFVKKVVESKDPDQLDAFVELCKKQKVDVWLPSVSMDGQNANLYEDEWQTALREVTSASKYAKSRRN